jgi:hypothetical protein
MLKYNVYVNTLFDNEASKLLEMSLTELGEKNLNHIIDKELDISDIIATHDLIEESNKELFKQDYSKYAFIGDSVVNNSFTQGYNRYNKSLNKIIESYSSLNAKLPELKKMSQGYSGSYKKNFNSISHNERE